MTAVSDFLIKLFRTCNDYILGETDTACNVSASWRNQWNTLDIITGYKKLVNHSYLAMLYAVCYLETFLLIKAAKYYICFYIYA